MVFYRFLPLSISIAAALALTACVGAEKSSNPLSPAVAGPIPGVNITAPAAVTPANGTNVPNNQQPVTLTIWNATTSGVRPLSYSFQIATDAAFTNIVFSQGGVAPGGQQTSFRLKDALGADRSYYWRARAEDGANSGPYSDPVQFRVFMPVVFQAPTLVTPINNVVVSSLRPRFTWNNAAKTGTSLSGVSYLVQVSDSSSFAASVQATVAEQSGQTSVDASADLPANAQGFWRVQAFDSTSTGPWSATESFRTPAAAGGGGGGGTPTGAPGTWSADQWHDYFFGLLAQKGFPATVGACCVTSQAVQAIRPDLNAKGADLQVNGSGQVRVGRVYLPTPTSGPLTGDFSRAVDYGAEGAAWQWLVR